MTEEHPALEAVLGKEVVAYYTENDETMLRFDDGTILQWSGHYNLPLHGEEEGLSEIWGERAEGEWREVNDNEENDC